MLELDYLLLQLTYLVDLFVAENRIDYRNIDYDKLNAYDIVLNIGEEKLLSEMYVSDIRDYLSERYDVDDIVCFR